MPLEIAYHPTALLPVTSPVVKLYVLYLYSGHGRPPHRAGADLRLHDLAQGFVHGHTDELSYVLLHEIVIDVGQGKGCVAPEPEQFQTAEVSRNQGLYKIKCAIHRMHIAGPQLGVQAILIAGEGNYGMESGLAEIANIGLALLLPICRVFSGINLNDQAILVLAFD